MYLHERKNWTKFTWDDSAILPLVARVRYAQGELMGLMSSVGFELEQTMESHVLASEVIASSKIEGVQLDVEKVRSSVCKQLGIPQLDETPDTRDVDGIVAVMFDATRNFNSPLDEERLFGWHNSLFPAGYSGLRKINVARYRTNEMSVVSGPFGHERTHFEAPKPQCVAALMDAFLSWLNADLNVFAKCANGDEPISMDAGCDALVKVALAHLWFLTIHPFDDGNGRIARVITEMLLCRVDRSLRRFYSMANYILAHRDDYYAAIERAQKGTSDVTHWLLWFFAALESSVFQSTEKVRDVLSRERFWSQLAGVALNERQRDMLMRLKGDFEGKLTASKWAKMQKVSPDTALRDINDLIAKGVLKRGDKGGRSVDYVLVDRA